MTIRETLRGYFQKNNMNGKVFTDEDSLLASGVLDSLAIVKLLAFIESEFNVSIPDSDFDPDNFESIKSISVLIERNRS